VDRNEFRLEEDKLGYRAARLALITAIIGLISYVAHETLDYLKYLHKQKEMEAQFSARDTKAANSGPAPFLTTRSSGPDLEVEAGLKLEGVSTKNPDGTGEMVRNVTDYPPGKYRLQDAPNAGQVLALLKNDINDYLGFRYPGLAVEAEAIGCADGIPVKDGIYYKGDLGLIRDEEYHSYDSNENRRISFVPGQTRLSNEGIAFLRAYDMLSGLAALSSFHQAKPRISIDTTDKIGGEYRRVLVRISIKNALREEYDGLGPIVKSVILPLTTK
jgi:hypothetical protein